MNKIAASMAAILLCAAPAGAEIKKCVGPGGELQYVNTECPEGYRLEGSMPSSQASAGGDDELFRVPSFDGSQP